MRRVVPSKRRFSSTTEGIPFRIRELTSQIRDLPVASDEPGNPAKKGDMVITPGGARRGDLVHRVGPGQAVRMGESGSAVVGHQGRNAMAGNRVLPPRGFLPPPLVHPV